MFPAQIVSYQFFKLVEVTTDSPELTVQQLISWPRVGRGTGKPWPLFIYLLA